MSWNTSTRFSTNYSNHSGRSCDGFPRTPSLSPFFVLFSISGGSYDGLRHSVPLDLSLVVDVGCSVSCNADVGDVGVAELEELVENLKKLCTSYRPIFSKISKYCFNSSNGTETITVSILFRRLKNTVFTLPGLAILRTLTSSKRTQNRNTPFTTEACVVRKTHFFFFFFLLVFQVSLYGCAVASVLWKVARLRVGALTDRLLSPCHHPPVTSLLPRICLVGRTTVPSQLQAAPTPRRCDGSKDKKTTQTSVWDDMAVIFSVHKAARRREKIAKLKN